MKKMVTFRDALLRKQVMKLVADSDNLWVSVVKWKHKIRSPRDLINRQPRGSWIWRGLCKIAPRVMIRVWWTVGDGESIDILDDRWMCRERR